MRRIASLVALLPIGAGAQTLMGRVVDARTGEPLAVAGVGVRVTADSVIRVRTGSDGVFAVQLPAAATVVVHIQASIAPPVISDSVTVPADSVVQREFRVPMPPDPVFYDYQVDAPAAPIPTSAGPRYPAHLKDSGVEGEVFVNFVVDTSGQPVMDTFRVLRQTHADFTSAVRATMPRLRFRPAERRGRKVSMLVEQPFTFCLVLDPPRRDGPCRESPR